MTFKTLVGSGSTGIIGAINIVVIPTIFALCFAFFLFGILKYFFLSTSNETERKRGREFALWGLLGIVLLLAIWGVLNLALSTLGIPQGS